jgi:hypothetical protein
MDYETFKNTTKGYDYFKIIDVDSDNKCFYRAVVNEMLHRSDIHSIKHPISLINKRLFRVNNSVDQYPIVDIDFMEKARIALEVKTLSWLNNHRDDFFPELGIKIKEVVEMTHEIPFDLYIRRDIEDEPIWGGLPEQVAISNLYNVPIHIYRPVRFNKTNCKIHEGIIRYNNVNKDVRFQHAQTINPFKNKSNNSLPFYLLWKRYSDGSDHYMSLLENSQ